MARLRRMLIETDAIKFYAGAILIPDRAYLELVLPQYFNTGKYTSFTRQLNNFGFQREYDPPGRVNEAYTRTLLRGLPCGVRYRKVVGSPPRSLDELLTLRPLVRRSRKRTFDGDIACFQQTKRPFLSMREQDDKILASL